MSSSEKAQDLLGRKSCSYCGLRNLSVLAIIDKDGIPPAEPKHNIGYYHIMLAKCQDCGRGMVERLDHDCFDFDSVFDQYEWYLLDRPTVTKLLKSFQSCPDPMRHDCDCAIHHSLRSSIDSLPKNPWRWAFEDDLHVHKISLKWAEGLPILEAIHHLKKD